MMLWTKPLNYQRKEVTKFSSNYLFELKCIATTHYYPTVVIVIVIVNPKHRKRHSKEAVRRAPAYSRAHQQLELTNYSMYV